MDRYHIIKKVGEGSFGRVYQAIDHLTGQYVAIKQLKPNCHPMSYLPEVRALQILQHPKIVGFKGAERQHNTVFLVFEYMDGSLRHLINHRMRMGVPFSEAEIKFFSFQVLQGLDFMHRNRRFMHRDMKPENLLVNKHGVLKISDLGSATEIESDDSLFHHHYVTTRSYRAPEMLLRMFLKNEELRPFDCFDANIHTPALAKIKFALRKHTLAQLEVEGVTRNAAKYISSSLSKKGKAPKV
uniref:serine/threonine-protein kinase MHK-like n=1 Tax=Fragaria vesca subsp. vesca TaxID=101020 RepID=UPI0005CB0136|nr:PREDICTED: serine/threonine-protein kinase MHK-like [Fragaria vesca subsp. vesca]